MNKKYYNILLLNYKYFNYFFYIKNYFTINYV